MDELQAPTKRRGRGGYQWVNQAVGGCAGVTFRLLAYTFLRWLPGRQGTYLVPAFFALHALTLFLHNLQLTPDLKPIPTPTPIVDDPNAPSYAQVVASNSAAASDESSDLELDATASSSSTTSPSNSLGLVQRKKNKNKSASSVATTTASADEDATPPSARSGASRLSALLFSTPSSSPTLNAFNLAINTLLLAACLDALWSPILGMQEHDLAFARVGQVDHSSVKILARIPPLATVVTPVNTTSEGLWQTEQTPGAGAKLAYRPSKPLGRWIMGPTLEVSEESDWTGVVRLDGLYASTEYEYRLLVPALSNAHHPSFPDIQSFTTFPDPALASFASPGAGTHFTFAATSCVKPGFPYKGPQYRREVIGAKYLMDSVVDNGVKFLVFLGDFIYSDSPVYPGPAKENYWKRYRQVMAAPYMKALLTKIPTMAIWDDHEIFNDFSASVASDHPERFPPASVAYDHYLGNVNPDPIKEDVRYFKFQHGDAAFFVLDTRSYRSANGAPDDEEKTMLGERQKVVFLDWLAKVNQTVTWKFVISSVPMQTLWSLSDDTWAGFQTEREAILDVMEWVPNVIVISGDRHEFAAASLRTTITEFSTSPLNQFYLPIRTLSQANNRGATGEDILLKYLPDGNSKFSTFEVDTRVANQPVVRVRVVIDGEEAWAVDVQGKQLEIPPPPKGIGSLGKSLMELLGFKKRSWF
ncbi:hypothetical protein RQP46_003846 [Phenoliferia psychrophenolica]